MSAITATSENINLVCSPIRPDEDIWGIQDPVRPDIPLLWRVEPPNKFTYYMASNKGPKKRVDAICCLALLDKIPTTEEELMSYGEGDIAVFYTVFSRNTVSPMPGSTRRGKGREVLNNTIQEISKMPVTRYITLSPKTEMAKKFHLNNGAVLLQENETTLNFEYTLSEEGE